MRVDILACPDCRGELRIEDERVACGQCGAAYDRDGDIPFFDPSDAFYDAYAAEHCPYHLSPGGYKEFILRYLPFWSWREWKFWSAVVPACDRLLDLGCGRGRQFFAERAEETVGLDGSAAFLRDCRDHYDVVAQGSLPRLPFASSSFDVVTSSHVMGHIPEANKDELVSEIARVLKPGGITAHIVETDSEHPMVRAAKTKPDAYASQFMLQDGHIGLEPASAVISRFQRCGFRVRTLRLVDAIVPSLSNYRKLFVHPEFEDIPHAKWMRRLDRVASLNPITNLAYEVGMGLFHRTVEQIMGKKDNAQFILVAFEAE